MIRWFLCFAFIGLAVPIALGDPAHAQDKPRARNAKAKVEKSEKSAEVAAVPFSLEREEAVNSFVEEHHPELATLLGHLKKNREKQYEKAVKELYNTSTKLASLKKSDADLYDLELKAWKLKSRIQLLSARLIMSSDEELKTDLKTALADQLDIRHEIMRHQRELLRERLKRMDREMTEYELRRETAVERQFEIISNEAKAKTGKRTKDSPSKPPPAKTTSVK